ncbi:MAG: HNH endonuclease [Candidatus Pristimantibacillus lignocellulolyticus]|uniref:HNH endonuclease n=1 Tax=Candidatus Pristimantibacillus lignocellulolyticus TaxID=2994561 RepID=A0A9J6ZHF4_9BACL|nr:MAG: HNH endonuclease [Candidatus Pristimantibacillus lignocellulolyticus]
MVETNKKYCISCGQEKPISDFLRRTGRRESQNSRRGTCKRCRQAGTSLAGRGQVAETLSFSVPHNTGRAKWTRKKRQPASYHRQSPNSENSIVRADDIRPTSRGVVRMRGRSDTGRRWYEEIDPQQAKVLVKEGAAIIINPYTIRMVYSNKEFRRFILMRDHLTCHYCGESGDTIDHLLPRAKGGYTTPANCVCACLTCNQQKGNLTTEQFMNYLFMQSKDTVEV